jgi:homoserine dehydrogenase
VKPLSVWVVGFGTVGQWLVRALDMEAARLAARYGIGVTVVGLANARDGFIYDPKGLDLRSVLGRASDGTSIAEQPGVRCWPSAIDGLRATEADLLVEVTASRATDGEPGLTRMREALQRRVPVRFIPTSFRPMTRLARWSGASPAPAQVARRRPLTRMAAEAATAT